MTKQDLFGPSRDQESRGLHTLLTEVNSLLNCSSKIPLAAMSFYNLEFELEANFLDPKEDWCRNR